MDDKAKETSLNQISYGLYVLGSCAGDQVNGMTFNWLTQVSFDPPLVAIAVQSGSHTRKLIDEGQVFSVNIIAQGRKDLLTRFIKPHRRVGEKLGNEEGETAYHTATTGAPILDEAISYFECEVRQATELGDHVLYIGEVVGAGVQQEGTPIKLEETGWSYGG